MGTRTSRIDAFLPVLFLMGIGMFLVWYSTAWGAGLISDSFQYTSSARYLASGDGFSLPYGDGQLEPMTKYPPLFPVLLAGFELVGVKALLAARIVNIALMGVNILLVYLCTQKLARSYAFSLLAALLFSVSFVFVEIHSWALSEPLYICTGLCSILMLHKYFEEEKRSWLIYASVFVSAAFLTRYVGLSLVIAVAIIILADHRTRRFGNVLLFGSIATIPMILWTLRGYLLTQTLNDRTVAFHPLTIKNYVSAIDVVYGWFLPLSFVQGEEKILLGLTVIGLVAALFALRKFYSFSFSDLFKNPAPEKRIVLLHGLYMFLYMLMIVVSKTWVDPDIGLSDRVLSPMLVSLLILLAAGPSFLWNAFNKLRLTVVVIGFALTAYYVAGTVVLVQRFHEMGIGIARRGWTRSEVIQSLRSYSSYSIYTNSNSSLYLWSERAGYSIPEFEALKENGTDEEVLLVIFHHVPPQGKRLDALIEGLQTLGDDNILSVYSFAP
jgi:4-amino-4-deoxy-L-arabinose transferase-like glycosyltransferase